MTKEREQACKEDWELNGGEKFMSRTKEAALKFMLCAKELGLSQSEARFAADLMSRNAHNFLRHDHVNGKATPKRICYLESKGFRDVHNWNENAVNDMVAAIFANDWRVPDNINPATYAPPVSSEAAQDEA